jgi:hypothetical protein
MRCLTPITDYVWFTPRVDDEDPREKFKSQFDRMKKTQ